MFMGKAGFEFVLTCEQNLWAEYKEKAFLDVRLMKELACVGEHPEISVQEPRVQVQNIIYSKIYSSCMENIKGL